MHVGDLRLTQREGAVSNLASLAANCRRKFLNAARLLEWRSPVIDKLHSFGVGGPVDLWPLLTPHAVLAERYIEHFYSPQVSLFPTPGDEEDAKWGNYFRQVLVPHLVADDDVVRNVLRALRALPCKEPEQAALALRQHFTEMTLPHTRPLWSPEEVLDG